MLTPDEHDKIVALSTQLADFNSVTLALQMGETDLADARAYLDALLMKYPEIGQHLSVDAPIIDKDFKAFEKAIVAAIQRPDLLTDAEKQIQGTLLLVYSQEEIEEMPGSHLNDFAVSVRNAKKQRLDKKKLLWSLRFRLHRTSASGFSVSLNMFKRRKETECYPVTWKLSCS